MVATLLELQLAADATDKSAGELFKALGAAGAVVYPASTSPSSRDVSDLPVVKVYVKGEFKGDVETIARSAIDGVVKVHTPVPIKHFEGGLVLPGTSASSKPLPFPPLFFVFLPSCIWGLSTWVCVSFCNAWPLRALG